MENDDFPLLIYYSTTELHCSKVSDKWICSLSAVVPISILEFFFCRFYKCPIIYQTRVDNNIINEIVRIICSRIQHNVYLHVSKSTQGSKAHGYP